MEFHAFSKGINPKVNVIVCLEFKLVYSSNVTVQQLRHEDST